MKYKNNHILEASEKEEREQRIKNLFDKIMTENLLNLVKEKTDRYRKYRLSQ